MKVKTKNISLTESTIRILQKEAEEQKRELKPHIEFILIQHSLKYQASKTKN